MIATYVKALLNKSQSINDKQIDIAYQDGFKHGFDSGRSSCIGDLSVAQLTKELIDRGELKLAIILLKELKTRLIEDDSVY